MEQDRSKHYLNPYVGGVLLGLLLLITIFISGRGLGASGAIKSTVAAGVKVISKSHFQNAVAFKEFAASHTGSPLNSWLVYEMIGVLTGGFLSGAFAGRLKWKVEHNPKITSRRRILFAVLGGIFFGLGSQFGRGCTSGAALSGMAVLSLGGFITMMAIFGTAFALAYFFRKLWI
jgi:uncharacterized membrane protein YedE/YeeE